MRPPRIKTFERSLTYHVYNRVSGTKDELPFGRQEKATFIAILKRLAEFYCIDIIEHACMGNHYHLVIHVPAGLVPFVVAAERYQRYYNGERRLHPGTETALKQALRMRDISCFIRDLQQRMTVAYNGSHRKGKEKRRGSLWADRFKCSVLEDQTALWTAVKYVALNPVRAGMVRDAADYRFSGWGEGQGSGRHPWHATFVRHLKRVRGDAARDWTDEKLFAEFRADLARTRAADLKLPYSEMIDRMAKAKAGPTMGDALRVRGRYWIDGVIIGSEAFVRELATTVYDRETAMKRRLGLEPNGADPKLYTLRRLSVRPPTR